MDLKLINENYENLEDNKKLNKEKILRSSDYILFILFLFLVGFNIFFIKETKEINKDLISIKNITNIINIPYDVFNFDVNYTIIGLDVLFMLSASIMFLQVILCRNCSKYCIPFFVILYFLIPLMQINYIINTINLKKYINKNILSYIISCVLYISTYCFYTFGLTVNFFKTKI